MYRAPVSVVIPTHNRSQLVRDAIDSVLAQTLLPSQIIVIDDGSTDNTAEALRSYGNDILYRHQPNAGVPATRNHGIRLATERFVAFLDDDDVWHPSKLELQMRALEQEPALGLLGTEQFDWPAAVFPGAPRPGAGSIVPVTWEQLVVRTLIPISSVVVRREVLERVGGFSQSMCKPGSEDRDLFLKIADWAPVGMLRVPLCGYRDTAGSMCTQVYSRELAMRQILRQLDERRAWRGRWLLRSKAYSSMHHTCSAANARVGNHVGAVIREIKSLAYFPMPYRAGEVRVRLERPKRLAVNLLRLLGLKKPDPGPGARPLPIADALQELRYHRPVGSP